MQKYCNQVLTSSCSCKICLYCQLEHLLIDLAQSVQTDIHRVALGNMHNNGYKYLHNNAQLLLLS